MSRDTPELFRRFPQAGGIPWVPLRSLPTPVPPSPELSALAAPARVSVKRDDLSSPLYGGNKVRALEFLLGQALAEHADGVLTAGALGSHHVCATALFARQVGLSSEAVLWGQPLSPRCREALSLLARLGVPLSYRSSPALALAALLARWLAARARGRRLALLLPGGSTPRGVLGFVDAALELADQIAAGQAEAPGSIWLACGSGGSAAGLAVGIALAGLEARVRAVRVAPLIACNRLRLAGLVSGTRRLLSRAGVPLPARASPPELLHGFYAPGYARSNPAAEQAASALRAAGLPADVTYIGKAAAALLAHAPSEGGAHLFWHTLGAVTGESDASEAQLSHLPPSLLRLLAAIAESEG